MNGVTALPMVVLTLIAAACSSDSKEGADTTVATADTAASTATTPATGGGTAQSAAGGMLDPNSASRADLASIGGVSDSIAGALVAGRPYANMLAVDRVLARHLSEAKRDSVYARLWQPIDLNKATDAEILLIPGVGPRMLREFKEYRPYTSIEQFRREIGKYVDKNELARLERYVAIR